MSVAQMMRSCSGVMLCEACGPSEQCMADAFSPIPAYVKLTETTTEALCEHKLLLRTEL